LHHVVRSLSLLRSAHAEKIYGRGMISRHFRFNVWDFKKTRRIPFCGDRMNAASCALEAQCHHQQSAQFATSLVWAPTIVIGFADSNYLSIRKAEVALKWTSRLEPPENWSPWNIIKTTKRNISSYLKALI
jgi:hypothetical protein